MLGRGARETECEREIVSERDRERKCEIEWQAVKEWVFEEVDWWWWWPTMVTNAGESRWQRQ